MNELLTTRQLQELLKIDRITVYRMLNDGRLRGIKVGNQWRFSQSEINRLLGAEPSIAPIPVDSVSDFPIECVNRIQEIFAGILGIGAVTVSVRGTPLTETSFSNPFCSLMVSSPSGCLACQESWRNIALGSFTNPGFQICHAGLAYMRSAIRSKGLPVAWLIAGQYFLDKPDPEKQKTHFVELANKHEIPFDQLFEASLQIPVLQQNQSEQVREWTPKVAMALEFILYERRDLVSRLQRITELSSITPTMSK